MEHLRTIQVIGTDITLTLWDTSKREGDMGAFGRAILAYELKQGNQVLFSGSDYSPAPHLAIDCDDALIGILSFLTLRPGDTDDEYFASHTAAQLEWLDTDDADLLRLFSLDFDANDPDFPADFSSMFTEIDV